MKAPVTNAPRKSGYPIKVPLLAIVLTATAWNAALAQEATSPLELSPVEIEDIETPDASTRDSISLPKTWQTDPLPAPSPRRDSRLARLNRPIGQLHLDGLSQQNVVSQKGFTDRPPKVITASEISDLESLSCKTTYARRRLYFEDATLERCGYSDCVTSNGVLINPHSLAKFFVDTALLPFRMIKDHPDELVGSLAE